MLIPTLTFTPAPPLTREALTYTQAQAAFSTMRRPVYRFTVRLEPLTRSQIQCLSALYAYHKGAAPFYWDGGEYGRLDNYVIVGEGDGVTSLYFLPNRFIGTGSIAVQTLRRATGATSAWASGYTLTAAAGILTFTTLPVSGDDVMAKYACVYRLNFASRGIKLEEIAARAYRAELTLMENVLVG